MLRRGTIRITHRHVDDVLSPTTRRHLELTGDVENVGRQTLDTRELPHDGTDPKLARGQGRRDAAKRHRNGAAALRCNKTL
ncbi:hypothetical protein D554_2543 [Bordetella holmesii 30539]|nr:hypothetical protein D555_2621 [Bordetella holmesii 35009]EWM51997.1 hypothetical protein D557_1859 [Bordetella holmesii 70147]EXF87288.1 hypothetical protein D554_2543 [Bordetella holmesii 30539]